jgi:hypothetical protein
MGRHEHPADEKLGREDLLAIILAALMQRS